MDYNVKALLEKYWSGESSLEEEEQLRQYFHQENIAPDLEKYRSLFNYFGQQQVLSMNKKISTEHFEAAQKPLAKVRRLPAILWRVAAAVVLIIGLFSVYNNSLTEKPEAIVLVDTYDTEEEALQKIKETLALVSRKMNQGTHKAAKSLSKAQLATEVIKD